MFKKITLCVTFLFCTTLLFGQKAAKQNVESKSTIQPFALTNIAGAVQETDQQILSAKKLLNDTASYNQFVRKLTKITQQYKDTLTDSVQLDLEGLGLWELKPIQQQWMQYAEELTDFSSDINSFIAIENQKVDEISQLKKRWSRTKEQTDTAETTPTTEQAIKTALHTTDSTLQLLRAKIDLLVVTSNRASKELLQVNNTLDVIGEHTTEKGKDMFSKDSPPIWRMFSKQNNKKSLQQVFGESIHANQIVLIDFGKTNFYNIFKHLIFGILLFVLLRYIGRLFKSSEFKQDDDFKIADKILSYPALNAFVLFLVSISIFYPIVPTALIDTLTLLALVPIIVLLPKIFNQNMASFFYFLAALILLDKFQGQFRADIAWQRLFVLIETIVGIAGFFLFLLPKSQFGQRIRETKNVYLYRLLQIFLVILAASLLSNVQGNFQLSLLLTHGVIQAFSIGIIIFLAINISRLVLLFIIRSGASGRINVMKKYNHDIEKWTFILVSILGIFIWIKSVLRNFALLVPVKEELKTFVEKSWQFGEITLSVQNLLDFVTILFIFVVAANVLHILLREEVLKRFDLRKGFPLALAILTRYVILLLGFLLAMSSAGISLDKLSILIGALGVGIGFGLQNIVSNFVSGLVIIFERPVHIGDVVKAGQNEGTLTEIGLRSSKIRSWEGAEIIVPNNNLIANDVTNWTLTDKNRRVERILLIENASSPREVKNVIDNVLVGHKGMLSNPAPQSLFLGYEDYAFKFRLLFWLTDGILNTPSELMLNLHDALSANGFKVYMPVTKVVMQNTADIHGAENLKK